MAMTYNTLVAPKGTTGSIANWVGYSKLDIATILDEAQSLIYSMLRVRSMRTEWVFGMSVGESQKALPDRFLDPAGSLFDVTNTIEMGHPIEHDIKRLRSYESLSGNLGANPFTTANQATTVNVALTAHGLTQGSTFTIAGASAVGGLTLNGTFPVTAIIDDNNFTIDTGSAASSAATGGGSAATWTANKLVSGTPMQWGVWDEALKFDAAFDTDTQFTMLYYRAPALLSASNPSNFLTNRWPMLLRKACQTAAADFMKDDTEYQKGLTALSAMIQSIAAEDDLMLRGASFGTETP